MPGAARPKYIKQFFGAAPIRLGVGKTRNPQDGIDTQWNYPNPLFEATRWYYNELEWEDPATNAEVKLAYPGAQIGTPWVLLAADFAMSTGLEIAYKKIPTPSDLLQAANIFADMSRRAAHCCKCKPLPEGIIQQPAALAELSPYGLPSTKGLNARVKFRTGSAPFIYVLMLRKNQEIDTTFPLWGGPPEYTDIKHMVTYVPPGLQQKTSQLEMVRIGRAAAAAANDVTSRNAASTDVAPTNAAPNDATPTPRGCRCCRAACSECCNRRAQRVNETRGRPRRTASADVAPTKAAPTKKAPTKAAPTEAAPTNAAPTKAPTKKAPTKAALTEAAPTNAAPTKAPTKKAPTKKAPTKKAPTRTSP